MAQKHFFNIDLRRLKPHIFVNSLITPSRVLNLGRAFWSRCLMSAGMALASLTLPVGLFAQPTLQQRFTYALATEVGHQIPLPPGTWEATAVKTEEAPSNTTRHVVLKNVDTSAAIPFLTVRYSSRQYAANWSTACESKVWSSRHGTLPNQLVQKCQLIWMDKLPVPTENREKWSWSNLYSGFDGADSTLRKEPLIRTRLQVSMHKGHLVMVDLYARPSLAGYSAQTINERIRSQQTNAWAQAFMDWSGQYLEALHSSLIDKKFTAVAAFKAAASDPKVAAGPTTKPSPTLPASALPADAPQQTSHDRQKRDGSNRPEESEPAGLKEAMEKERLARQLRDQQAEKERLHSETQRLQAEVQRLQAQMDQQKQPVAPSMRTQRKALVIGNDAYRHTTKLSTAREDAKTMAQQLRAAGFTVTMRQDLTEKEMRATLRQFAAQVQGGDEVLFFYAGHGVQLGGVNYLIPVDTQGESEAQLRDEAVPLQRILDDMTERRVKLTVAVIDACRDNPFQLAGRSIGGATRGLAATTAATGQMIIFSAGSGQRALDNLGPADKSPNGVFTRVFVQEMKKRGIPIDKMVRNTRSEVVRLAQSIGHEQVPAIYDQVIGEFFLAP